MPATKPWHCQHGRQPSKCKECGGASICSHNRVRSQCKDCGGSGVCKHGRIRAQCKECGGKGICEHGRRRTRCKLCGGGGVCQHGRVRYSCKEVGCGPRSERVQLQATAVPASLGGQLALMEAHPIADAAVAPSQSDVAAAQHSWGQYQITTPPGYPAASAALAPPAYQAAWFPVAVATEIDGAAIVQSGAQLAMPFVPVAATALEGATWAVAQPWAGCEPTATASMPVMAPTWPPTSDAGGPSEAGTAAWGGTWVGGEPSGVAVEAVPMPTGAIRIAEAVVAGPE